MHGNLHYIILVKVNCVTMAAAGSLWGRKCNSYGTREFRSPTNCKNTSHWRCHNCSCGM